MEFYIIYGILSVIAAIAALGYFWCYLIQKLFKKLITDFHISKYEYEINMMRVKNEKNSILDELNKTLAKLDFEKENLPENDLDEKKDKD